MIANEPQIKAVLDVFRRLKPDYPQSLEGLAAYINDARAGKLSAETDAPIVKEIVETIKRYELPAAG